MRHLSWNLLQHLSRVYSLPWVIIGDFNDILNDREKRGRVLHPLHLLKGFREAVNSSGILDVELTGYPFTWSHCRGSSIFVEERLDEVMGNALWHAMFPRSRLFSLVAPTSDHCPILLDLDPVVVRRIFNASKFENKWLEERDLPEVVRRCWNGFWDFDVDKRLLATSETLGVWGKHIHLAFKKNKEDLESTIQRLQSRVDSESIFRYNDAKRRLADLLIREDIHWKQRAKVFWFKDGDTNTRFFHNMASMRRKKNHIGKLKDMNGEWVDSQNGLNEVVHNYFTDLFVGSNQVADDIDAMLSPLRLCVSEVDNNSLTAPFTKEEFKEAINEMHPDKAPGPDGFNLAFYQKFWSVVGDNIFDSCVRWIMPGSFPLGLNDTHVTLIPKTESPSSMKDLRPITLCNVVYKILSKVLCNRLKGVLPDLVDKSQSTFVQERAIQDNILIAFELLHSMKNKRKGKTGEMALKIDISKAYDRVDWTYLGCVLRRLGFCQVWVQWMLMCVQTVRYSFKVNDDLVGPISPGRGLCQGDPLSPYMFIFCAEGMTALIKQANREGCFHGVRVCRNSQVISHLLFTDDNLLFCRATNEEALPLKRILDTYETVSGQAINFGKSGIFFSAKVGDDRKMDIGNIIGVHQPLNTGRYLGLPSLLGRQKREIFASVRDKIWTKLHSWSNKKLSKAGKEVLIKNATQSILTYCMSVFSLPSTLLDEIHVMFNKFWWGNGSDGNKGVLWSNWDELCVGKDMGGMGFKNMHIFNLSLLGKMAWRLITDHSSLVCRILKAK
ncbi:hypothetical protein ACS0TY_034540 [Phlomoides rotata]